MSLFFAIISNSFLPILVNIIFAKNHIIGFHKSREGVSYLAEGANLSGIPSTWIESGTGDELKEERLRDWLENRVKVLFGTSA